MPVKTAVLVGANDAVGQRVRQDMERRGWRVLPIGLSAQSHQEGRLNPLDEEDVLRVAAALRAQEPKADMIILNIDRVAPTDVHTVLEPLDDNKILEEYGYCCVGVVRALHAFMPMLESGDGKRVCVITTDEGSQSLCKSDSGYGRRMAKASLNMAMKLLFNELHPAGYTFRMYCKDGAKAQTEPGAYAAEYFTRDRSFEPEDPPHSDENRLVLHDSFGGELPW